MKLLRNIILSLLIANTLGSALFVPLIYLDYTVRKDYISKVLCINKDKPDLKCNGKCFLAQKIKQVQEEEETSKNVSQKLEISFFFNRCPQFEFNNSLDYCLKTAIIYVISIYSEEYIHGIFHPPRA